MVCYFFPFFAFFIIFFWSLNCCTYVILNAGGFFPSSSSFSSSSAFSSSYFFTHIYIFLLLYIHQFPCFLVHISNKWGLYLIVNCFLTGFTDPLPDKGKNEYVWKRRDERERERLVPKILIIIAAGTQVKNTNISAVNWQWVLIGWKNPKRKNRLENGRVIEKRERGQLATRRDDVKTTVGFETQWCKDSSWISDAKQWGRTLRTSTCENCNREREN